MISLEFTIPSNDRTVEKLVASFVRFGVEHNFENSLRSLQVKTSKDSSFFFVRKKRNIDFDLEAAKQYEICEGVES